MEIRKCNNCMEDLPENEERCPACGAENQNISQPSYAMRCHSILHGRYLIGRVLGQGGFGLTYIGLDLTLNIKVAVKEYFPMGMASREQGKSLRLLWNPSKAGQAQRQNGYDNFLREARKMAKIDQIPSIVRVRDMFLDNETAYIVMDYVEGITLKQKIEQEGPMAFSQCIRLLAPMMEGLAKVHKQGMIHRDISPDNLMVRTDGSVWLLDLGAAKEMTAVHGQATQLVAKKGYSPLEQYMDRGKIGPWSDVYALCAVIYYCITGQILPASLERLDQEEIKFPPRLKENLSQQVVHTLKEGLAVRQENRIQSVEELLKRLKAGTSKQKSRWKVLVPALAGTGALAAAVFLGVWFFRQEPGHRAEKVNIYGEEIMEEAGETLTVERLGNSNANIYNYGAFALLPEQYEYFIGADNALYLCTCNPDDGMFYLGDSQKISDFGAYINVGEEHVYFGRTDYTENVICRMNFDGTGIEEICRFGQRDIKMIQYAKCSGGKEYLYYLVEKEQDSQVGYLYRYDLSSGKEELLVEEDGIWFNLYEDRLYMTVVREDNYVLIGGNLDGGEQKVLDDQNMYFAGFVEEGQMFLYSVKQEALIVCSLDGVQDTSMKEFYECKIDSATGNIGGYGDGWIYYTNKDDNSIHRIRANGTGDTVIAEGHPGFHICYHQGNISFFERNKVEKSGYSQLQLYFSTKDGETMFELFEPEKVWEELGTAMIPDLSYTENHDGSGIVITGYKGTQTAFQIPEEIEGKPVTEIGDEAFAESELEKVGLPEGVTFIGTRAFFNCQKLNFIGLPDSLKEIGEAAFGQTYGLTEVWFPEKLKAIGYMAFAESALASVCIPEYVEEISAGAFALAKTSELEAFEVDKNNQNFKSVDGVLYTKNGRILSSFPRGKKGTYTIPTNVEEIADMSFVHCTEIDSLKIPESVKKIGKNAFFDCSSLDSISIAEDCKIEELGKELKIKRISK